MDFYDALFLDPATATTEQLSEAVERLSWGVPPCEGYRALVVTDELMDALMARLA